MKKSLPIGKDDFQKLIMQGCYYVDKTRVIEELLDNNSEVILFPRPRRFGKSLFMSTLNNFFDVDRKEENKNLFDGLYINSSKYKDIQNTYPVINLSFKNLKQNTYESMVNQFRFLMSSVYNNKYYLLDSLNENEKRKFSLIAGERSNEDDLKDSIKFLSSCLYKYHNKKVVILIDEYDVPIQEGYIDGYYGNVVSFIRTVLTNCLKTNDSLFMGVLTGVLRVSKESIFSDLNNIDIYGMRDNMYDEYFGFTEDETRKLLKYYDLELTDEVKEMYDGYDFGNVNIYNPWSILNYANRKELDMYWINTSSNDLIKKILLETNSFNKNKIEYLVQGNYLPFVYNDKITYQDFDDYDNLDNILNLMFLSGYLTIAESKINLLGNREEYVKIPNLEVKKLITNIMSYLSIRGEKNNVYSLINEFNKALVSNDKVKIEVILNNMFMSLSFMDSQEYFYHAYTLGIFKSLLDSRLFIVKSNREGGMGRFDVSIRKVDNSIGFIVEFKLASSFEEMEKDAIIAMNQMKDKEYYKELVLDGVKDIKEVAIVFCEKNVIVR